MGNVACCVSGEPHEASTKAAAHKAKAVPGPADSCRESLEDGVAPAAGKQAPLEAQHNAVKAKQQQLDAAPLASSSGGTPSPASVVDGTPGGTAPADVIPTELILNLLDPENGPAAGLPYQPHFLGPPQPPCEDGRLATIRAMATVDLPPDPEIASILKTVASIFGSPAALVAKFEDKRVFISDSEGVVPRGDFPWRWTLCAWSLAYKNPQILVIPDTMQDARFKHNEKVTDGPKVRFYCGAPLVASNGHRLGTICFLDVKPRVFDASSAFIMNNFAELVVRRLEKDLQVQLTEKKNKELLQLYDGLQRAVDAVDTCVMMVDTHQEGWHIVYTNAALANITGAARCTIENRPLAEVFVSPSGSDGALPLAAHASAVVAGSSFAVDGVRLRGSVSTTPLTLNWRPASRAMDDAMVPVGVPSFLRMAGAPGDEGSVSPTRYYFVTVEPGRDRRGGGSSNLSMSMISSMASQATSSIDGLEMAHLLGKGAFGSVYAGTWWGAQVAVKIVDQELRALCPDKASLEALLGAELRHPHIVATLHHVTRLSPVCSASMAGRAGSVNDSALESGSVMSSSVTTSAGLVPPSVPTATSSIHGTSRTWAVINNGVPESLAEDGDDEADAAAAAAMRGSVSPEDVAVVRGDGVDFTAGDGTNDSPRHPVQLAFDLYSGPNNAAGDSYSGWSGADNVRSAQPGGSVCGYLSAAASGDIVDGATKTTNASSSSAMRSQTMIVLEYCDKGSLQEAIDRGWLRQAESAAERPEGEVEPVNMVALVDTAREIASAMAFLHTHNIVHGDLSAWNVMLSSSSSHSGRGFVAKIADFGLARDMHDTSRILTHTYGTLTHMPPETLVDGVISHAMDVYSFGVLLWQMYTGSRPWSGLRLPQIVMLVGQQGKQLQFLPGTPPDFVALAKSCMARDAAARPTFDRVLERLADLSADLAAAERASPARKFK